jgi:hypothetical protein
MDLDLNQFDLNGLTILWQSAQTIPNGVDFLNSVEEALQERVENNENFSREYLFQTCILQKQIIGISFIPTTAAYKNYGESITINNVFDDFERIEMSRNCEANPQKNTYGMVKAWSAVPDHSGKLLQFDFHTKEIREIIHRYII